MLIQPPGIYLRVGVNEEDLGPSSKVFSWGECLCIWLDPATSLSTCTSVQGGMTWSHGGEEFWLRDAGKTLQRLWQALKDGKRSWNKQWWFSLGALKAHRIHEVDIGQVLGIACVKSQR